MMIMTLLMTTRKAMEFFSVVDSVMQEGMPVQEMCLIITTFTGMQMMAWKTR